MRKTTLLFLEGKHCWVPSLTPFLSPISQVTVQADKLRLHKTSQCSWLGFQASKGVVDPYHNTVIYSPMLINPEGGQHGAMIQGFDGVDTTPACYSPDSELGFGNFIRFMVFARSKPAKTILGIDFSLSMAPRTGIANSMLSVAECARQLIIHGVPAKSELVLLNWDWTELNVLAQFRKRQNLLTMEDWSKSLSQKFLYGTEYCPRCGQSTLIADGDYCYACGGKSILFYKRRFQNVEKRTIRNN